MSEGLFVEDDKDEDEAESDASEVTNFVAPVNVMERKTKKERRKEKRKRALVSKIYCCVNLIVIMTRTRIEGNREEKGKEMQSFVSPKFNIFSNQKGS